MATDDRRRTTDDRAANAERRTPYAEQSATIMERSMLRTRVARGACWFDVCTYVGVRGSAFGVRTREAGATTATDDRLGPNANRQTPNADDGPPPWTAVWRRPCIALAYLRYYRGPTSPGGLEEAHQAVVSQVRAGTLPSEGTR